jgi:glucose-6-phosphate-specific signal transduction histidine kinase
MKSLVITATLNFFAFMCTVTYAQLWNDKGGTYLELLLVPVLAIILNLLARFFLKKYYFEYWNKYNLKTAIGTATGQVLGVSLVWLILEMLS